MAIEFAHTGLPSEFEGLHPSVKAVVQALQAHSEAAGFPGVVVTHCWRSKQSQKTIYLGVGAAILQKMKRDATLTEEESRILERVEAISTAQNLPIDKAFESWTDSKFSWHMARCAVDLRNRHYSPKQRQAVVAFLRSMVSRGEWELLEHDIGRGDHIHLAKKDSEWKAKWAA